MKIRGLKPGDYYQHLKNNGVDPKTAEELTIGLWPKWKYTGSLNEYIK